MVLLGSYADRKPGPSGANYVGEKLPFSMSNAQLLKEPAQSCYLRTATSHAKDKVSLHKHYQVAYSAPTASVHEMHVFSSLPSYDET